MKELTIIEQNEGYYIDSREAAEIIGKRHCDLLRDINKYCNFMRKTTQRKIALSGFFIDNSYTDATGRILPCYYITKMGCELIANKLTGEKGILFTVAYVTKFNEMEATERNALKVKIKELETFPAPRLGEINATARIIVHAMKNIGLSSESIYNFLYKIYDPFGIQIIKCDDIIKTPRLYTAKQIAELIGIYSMNGKPHNQAVSAILNENIFIGDRHKYIIPTDFGNRAGIIIKYDNYAFESVKDWLDEYNKPNEIYGFERVYRVQYKK